MAHRWILSINENTYLMFLESIKNSYCPQCNIRSLVFIQIWPALTEIKFQNRAVKINRKVNTGTHEVSSGS